MPGTLQNLIMEEKPFVGSLEMPICSYDFEYSLPKQRIEEEVIFELIHYALSETNMSLQRLHHKLEKKI